MKIAVFKPWLAAEYGGGSSFEHGVWNALWSLAPQSRHEWVGLTWDADARDNGHPMLALNAGRGRRLLQRMRERLFGRGPEAARTDPTDRLLIENDIDLVLSLNPYFAGTELPFITVVWDLEHRLKPFFPEVSTGGEWILREHAYRAGLARASRVLVGTETGRREIERFYSIPPERISVLPLPAPDFAFRPPPSDRETRAVLERHGLEPGFLFYPAQFWPHKNHRGVLLALRRLKDAGHRLTCVFVGSDRGNLAHVKEIARTEGVLDQVRWLGFVGTEEMQALYRSALALVYLSFFGPDNLPPLEAFALGCPVVAAAIPGAREQLGHHALLVDPADPKAVAAAIERLASDPSLRRTLVEKGLTRPRFTCADYVHRLWEVVDTLEPIRACWNNQAYGHYGASRRR